MSSVGRRGLVAVMLTLMMALPAFAAYTGEERAVPDITFLVNELSFGNPTETVEFQYAGIDDSLAITLPNGATVLSATLNISGLPLTDGGTDCPENVSLDVAGQSPPEYEFRGVGYGQMGHQTLFSTGKPVLNVTTPYSGGTNTSSAIRLPKSAVVKRAVMNVSSGGGLGGSGKVLIIGAASPSYNADIQTKLKSFPDIQAADIVQAQSETPTLARLKEYSSVLVLSDYGFQDATTLGNNLADYVDSGGGVVLGMFCPGGGSLGPGGRFVTGGYLVFPQSGYQYSSGSLGTYDASHPIMQNVKTFTNNNYRPSSNQIVSGATLVASYTDGIPIVATKNVNGVDRVDLGFYPPSSDAISSSWSSATDGKYIIHNALVFAGRANLNASLDILGDQTIEWSNTSFNSTAKIPEFSAMLNAYLATSPVNGTDKYGNQYVDIPIHVSSNMSGMLQLCNLSISYDYTATVNEVKLVGTLADALSDALPPAYDGRRTNITLSVSSTKSGKVRISDVSVVYRPPVHPPFLDSKDPGSDTVVMNENESMVFRIAASDEYGYPLTPVWYQDTLEAARGNWSFTYSADFTSAGDHSVRVNVNNTLRSVETTWKIKVLNVNRPPAIDTFYPDDEVTIDEEGALTLGVAASDPDPEDRELSYTWYVGSVDQKITGDSFRFSTDLKSAGVHSIRVKVTDPGGLSVSRTWRVTVLNVNVPPVVDSLQPNLNPRIRETEAVTFSIAASDFDKQPLIYRWYLDGTEVGTGQQYTLRTGYDSAGTHVVRVVITDGEANVSRNWTVTVENVNRMPVPVIDKPVGKLDFLETELVEFSARSSSDPDGDTLKYRWLEGSRELATTSEFSARFPRGPHEVTLEVTDQNRAANRTSVRFTVHYVKLVANLDYDLIAPVEGETVRFTAWVNNTGDAEATGVEVELLVDGTSLGRTQIDDVPGGGTGSATFSWKARRGEHVVTVRVGTQSWNSTLSVAGKPAAAGGDQTLMMLVVVGVVAAVVVGGVAFAMTRKKQPAPPAPPAVIAPPETATPAVVPLMTRTGEAKAAPAAAEKPKPKEKAPEPKPKEEAPKAKPKEEASKPGGKCPHCKEPLEPGWSVCPSCGGKV
ncbi:MAG: hypothetical protein FJ149_06975 [Euryarchaeota archaeon]|nr:hypothetical protein [Euryarchaeota archaeon]